MCSFDRRTPSAQSNLTNKSRLRLLHRREEQVQELFETARSQIATSAEDEDRYFQFLEGAIVQGFLQLMEPHVTLIVREKDVERAQKAAEAAAETYDQLSGRQVVVDIQGLLSDDRYVLVNYLSTAYGSPSASSGGVKLANGSKRITIDNTLDERLRLLEDRVSNLFERRCFSHRYSNRCYPRSGEISLVPTRIESSIRNPMQTIRIKYPSAS